MSFNFKQTDKLFLFYEDNSYNKNYFSSITIYRTTETVQIQPEIMNFTCYFQRFNMIS
jgi:hypothetical protein